MACHGGGMVVVIVKYTAMDDSINDI